VIGRRTLAHERMVTHGLVGHAMDRHAFADGVNQAMIETG
jgi:hypothetical protein